MESQGLLDYVIKVTASGARVYIGQSLVCGRRNPPPQAPAPSLILISSVIFSLISHYYRVILPQYAAIVLSFHISHSDIAFVVKFRFCEGLSEMWGGPDSNPPIYNTIYWVYLVCACVCACVCVCVCLCA